MFLKSSSNSSNSKLSINRDLLDSLALGRFEQQQKRLDSMGTKPAASLWEPGSITRDLRG